MNWIGISVRVIDQDENPVSGLGNVQYQIYTEFGGNFLGGGTLTSAGSGLYKFCDTGADYPTDPKPYIVGQTSNACTTNAGATSMVSQSNNPSCP